jgi:hypothetical protein
MTQLARMTLDNGAVIFIEVNEDVAPPTISSPPTEASGRQEKGVVDDVMKSFQSMQQTIQAYTQYTLDAFREVAAANVDKVTLEFGIKMAGEIGVPYVTRGTTESNLKITVECSFSKELGTSSSAGE